MSNETGPWSNLPPPPAPPPGPSRRAGWAWLVIIAGIAALVFALTRIFPGAVRSGDDWAQVGYLAGFLLLVAAGLTRVNRTSLPRLLRYAAIWIGLAAVIGLGLAFQDDIAGWFGRPAGGHAAPNSASR